MTRRNEEVTVWHEFGHHVFYKYNPTISSLYNQVGQVFATELIESYADLIESAIALNTNPSTLAGHTFGSPWVHGDGNHGGTDRVLNDPSLTFAYLNQNLDPHETGRAISSFFYQVVTASGITPTRYLELLLQVGAGIKDDDGNGLDLIDLKNALIKSTRSGETALLNAVNTKFAAMYQSLPGGGSGPLPIGAPAPVGSPPPPFPVTAVFVGCSTLNGSPVSRWRVDWPSVPGATLYNAYLKFQFATYIQDAASLSGVQIFAETNAPAWVFVASCNASGCGHTSMQASIYHVSQCANF